MEKFWLPDRKFWLPTSFNKYLIQDTLLNVTLHARKIIHVAGKKQYTKESTNVTCSY